MEKGKKYYKGLGDTTRGLPSQVDSVPPDPGYVSWETYAIFKDDDDRRDYSFGEIVTGLGGNDIGVIQPPFSILPERGNGFGEACSGGPAGIQTQEFVIENVPYEYAIPMLTGWQLSYGCLGDQRVKEIGVWIADIHYDKNQGTSLATLRYNLSSIIGDGGHANISKVTILGLKSVAPGGKPVPDLVPFSPSGTGPTAFCRLEQNNNSLRVSIKNQGNADAGASKTTVTFGNNAPQTLDTPAIPAGGSVDLLFRVPVPSNCVIHNCSFKITVDSSNQVDEQNEGNNTVNDGC
jgi:CARDB protein